MAVLISLPPPTRKTPIASDVQVSKSHMPGLTPITRLSGMFTGCLLRCNKPKVHSDISTSRGILKFDFRNVIGVIFEVGESFSNKN